MANVPLYVWALLAMVVGFGLCVYVANFDPIVFQQMRRQRRWRAVRGSKAVHGSVPLVKAYFVNRED